MVTAEIRDSILKFLDSDGYEYLVSQLRDKYFKDWETSSADEYERRDSAYHRICALRELDKEIRIFVASLKLTNT